MDNSSCYTLAALNLTAALTSQVQTTIDGLDGLAAITLVADFGYGSGGTTASVTVQTALDGGTIWYDIARFDFTTSSRKAVCNLEGLLSKAVTTYAALSSEGVLDGIFGNMLRAVVTTTGVYVNTTLDVRASVR
jgi:hypothetical protein